MGRVVSQSYPKHTTYYFKYIAIVDRALLSAPSSADREKRDGIVYTWKDYGDKVFEITLTRHPSASMIIAVNDYYENDVINVKDGECQKSSAAYVGGQTKNVFPTKERHFLDIKEFNSFFPESSEQNPSASFPEITFCTEMQATRYQIYLSQKK